MKLSACVFYSCVIDAYGSVLPTHVKCSSSFGHFAKIAVLHAEFCI